MNDLSLCNGLLLLGLLVTSACVPSSDLSEEDVDEDLHAASGTRYVELGSSLEDPSQWRAVVDGVQEGFDRICGDTFCEGDWSNIESLAFECSVSEKLGKVRECVWAFAASDAAVAPADGAVHTQVPFFVCRVRPKATGPELVAALASDPLYAPLPGLGTSFYDALGECLEAPMDIEPYPAFEAEGSFTDASGVLEGEEIDAWYTMRAGLRAEADAVFGDGAEGTDWQSLGLRCSVDAASKKLGTCAWSFARLSPQLKKAGTYGISDREAATCVFHPDATAMELATALAPSDGSVALLDRPLPGGTGALADVLLDCL